VVSDARIGHRDPTEQVRQDRRIEDAGHGGEPHVIGVAFSDSRRERTTNTYKLLGR
jgi:hypothetical protein